jgi:hypothetical protein
MDGAETLHIFIPLFSLSLSLAPPPPPPLFSVSVFFYMSCENEHFFLGVAARFVPLFTVFAERFLIMWFGVSSLYDNMWDDGNSLGPKEVHSYLTRVMYNRRNKFDPLWNSLVLGGVKNGQKYLGMVDIIDNFI